MPKVYDKKKDKEEEGLSPEDKLIARYKKEWNAWYPVLETWHINRFNKNYELYTGNIDIKGTQSSISDPVANELVERVNQKLFEREPKFYVVTPGHNLPKEVSSVITGIATFLWNNPDTIQSTGTSKAKTKVLGREFLVVGNAGTETYFNGEADSADFRPIPIEDVIFDPTKTLKSSDVYYIRQFVSLDELEDLAEVKEKGKVVSGIFKKSAIDELKRQYSEPDGLKEDSTSNFINRSGSSQFQRPSGKIELISRWEGSKLCQIVNWKYIIREVDDPMLLGDDPLDFAMDIEVNKQPYGLSLIDTISGLVNAKNLIINQVIDYGAKALNPPLFVDPSVTVANMKTLRNAWKLGGIVMANAQQAQYGDMPALPAIGFDLMTYLQQRSESTTGIGAYTGGVPNQVSDKTAGTATGIKALIEQAASPIKDRQQNLEESIIEPVINKMLKMTGALMSDKEVKWVLISGEEPKWIRVTKGILTGKITLPDLLTAELIDQESFSEIAQGMQARGLDPNSAVVFDVDWVVRVEAGSMAEVDSAQDIENFDGWVAFCQQMGVPLDVIKIAKERGIKAGIKEPENYIMQQAPQAQGADPQQMMQEQQMQQQQMMQKQQFVQQGQMHDAKMAQEHAKVDQMQTDAMAKKVEVLKKLQEPIKTNRISK